MVYLAELYLSWQIGSKLSELMLEMYPVHGHKRLDDDASLSSLDLAPGKRRYHVLDAPGCRPVET